MLLEQIRADYQEALRRQDGRTVQALGAIIRNAQGSEPAARQLVEDRLARPYTFKVGQLLRGYLSKQHLTDEEITTIAIRQHSIRSVPQILQYFRENYAGRYDPKRAATIVRELTS